MAYIIGATKWDGGHADKDNYLVCDKCGSKKIRMVAHFDGPKIYGYDYNCECGAHIRATTKRDGRPWKNGVDS